MRRWITSFGVVLLVLALASCLPVPLGSPAKSKVDPALKGVWLLGENLVCVVAPLDDHVYAIELIHVEQDETGSVSRGRSDALRGWITEIKGHQFITLEPLIHVADDALPVEDRDMLYVVAKFARQGNDLSIAMISPQEEANLTTADQLAKLVTERADDPEFYLEAGTGRKLDSSKEADRAYFALLTNPWTSD